MPGRAAQQSPGPGVTTRFPLLIPILDQHYAAQQIVNAVETNKVMLYMPAQGPRKGMAREESFMLSWQAWFVAFFPLECEPSQIYSTFFCISRDRFFLTQFFFFIFAIHPTFCERHRNLLDFSLSQTFRRSPARTMIWSLTWLHTGSVAWAPRRLRGVQGSKVPNRKIRICTLIHTLSGVLLVPPFPGRFSKVLN